MPGACNVDDVFRDRELIDWLRRRGTRCRRVCSVCVGTFLLAEAGLLRGRRAVTHWMHCDVLAARYPEVTIEPDAIYVHDGAIWTSAGVTTRIDLALALIEQDCGRAVAMHVARVLVVYLRRVGGQSQYSALLASQVESASEARSQTFTKERRGETHVRESFSAVAEGGEIRLSLAYRQGGMVMWVTAERPNLPLYAAREPRIVRWYQEDQVIDIVRSDPMKVNGVIEMSLEARGELADVFDGQQRVVGVAIQRPYIRQVYVP